MVTTNLLGGHNSYCAKLTDIADKNTQQKYKQTWTITWVFAKAKITKKYEGRRIYLRHIQTGCGMEGIDEDTASLLRKDIAGTVQDVKVFLNGERLKIKQWSALGGKSHLRFQNPSQFLLIT
jgi:DNA topoisomerase-2